MLVRLSGDDLGQFRHCYSHLGDIEFWCPKQSLQKQSTDLTNNINLSLEAKRASIIIQSTED